MAMLLFLAAGASSRSTLWTLSASLRSRCAA